MKNCLIVLGLLMILPGAVDAGQVKKAVVYSKYRTTQTVRLYTSASIKPKQRLKLYVKKKQTPTMRNFLPRHRSVVIVNQGSNTVLTSQIHIED